MEAIRRLFMTSPFQVESVASALWLIIALPAAGAFINGVFGKALGRANVNLIGVATVVGSFILSVLTFWAVNDGSTYFSSPFSEAPIRYAVAADYATWFRAGDFQVHFALRVDHLTATMLMVITGVGSLIHLYSTEYMGHDPGYWRYFSYLNLFVAMMLTLVMADNLLLLFVGWEGVGLCSYLLIGFWYSDPAKAFAGRKAFITNRIGDFGFLIGTFLLVVMVGAFSRQAGPSNFTNTSAGNAFRAGLAHRGPLDFQGLETIAGSLPVSAVIHAATMVTAGVYLFARLSYLLVLSPLAMAAVAVVGALTALWAALIAFAQDDIKKVLAYSTVSQLGFMFIGIGVGAFWAAVLHLVTHAFFKACLFLGAGSVMHGNADETDIKKMGGLRPHMPTTWATFAVATAAITGVVPLSGFFSKDSILHAAHSTTIAGMGGVTTAVWLLGLLSAACTAFYMTRLYILTFEGRRARDARIPAERVHESAWPMTLPLVILSALAVVAIVYGIPLMRGAGEHLEPVMQNFLSPVFRTAERIHTAQETFQVDHSGSLVFSWVLAWVIAVAATAAAAFAYLRFFPSRAGRAVPLVARRVRTWAREKFYVDELYELALVKPVKFASFV